jgi:hypothetical protein
VQGPGDWPVLVVARLPADQGGHPLLVTGTHGAGRTLVRTSDIGPHWLPDAFVQWPGYATLWRNTLAWLTRAIRWRMCASRRECRCRLCRGPARRRTAGRTASTVCLVRRAGRQPGRGRSHLRHPRATGGRRIATFLRRSGGASRRWRDTRSSDPRRPGGGRAVGHAVRCLRGHSRHWRIFVPSAGIGLVPRPARSSRSGRPITHKVRRPGGRFA